METYFAESTKSCEQQSFSPVNQSSFLRLPQIVFKKKNSTMLQEVVVSVWVEDQLYSIWTVDCSNRYVLLGIRKNCEKQSYAPVNQSSFLRLPQMVFKKKNSTMLQEVVVSVWVEDQLYSILTVDCSNGNVLCGIRKKLWTTVFCTSKSIVISEASTNAI